jgi:cobalt/nickel transport system permease protein
MHIPDGFLSTPVWLALDAAALPAVGIVARRTQNAVEQSRIPLLGVMGAFVFAAQMINFPVGLGTSGHLLGGALLAMTLGPGSASLVMTAILLVQALVFQDGGVLALGANISNMALFGVLAGYLPYHLWGLGNHRKLAIFAGGFLSVMVSALLAISELFLSGVRMPGPVLGVSVALFCVSAVLEGVITLAVIQALETLNPNFVQKPAASGRALQAIALAALLLAVVGVLFASAQPDGLEKLAETIGISGREQTTVASPVPDYELAWIESPWLRKAAAGLVGLGIIYVLCLGLGRLLKGRSLAKAGQESA